jgi:hypothetical protein
MRLVTEMVGQLDLHRPLDQPPGQLRQQAAGPGDLRLGSRAGQQLVDHLVRDRLAVGPLRHAAQCRAVHGVTNLLRSRNLDRSRTQGRRRRLAWRLAAGAIR